MAWGAGQKVEGRYDGEWWEAMVEEVHKEWVQVTAHDACALTLALLPAWDLAFQLASFSRFPIPLLKDNLL